MNKNKEEICDDNNLNENQLTRAVDKCAQAIDEISSYVNSVNDIIKEMNERNNSFTKTWLNLIIDESISDTEEKKV